MSSHLTKLFYSVKYISHIRYSYNCIVVLLLLLFESRAYGAWTTDIVPKLIIKYDQEKLPMFYGNVSDYFRILHQDNRSLLIGARNAVYNISVNGLIENQRQRIEWKASDAHFQLCVLKGKEESDCQNYIRIYARLSDNQIMICGTNAYKPQCRTYKWHRNHRHPDDSNAIDAITTPFEYISEQEAKGQCPYSPTHNSSFLYTDGQLYTATVADFSGGDSLIYRETQRTEQFDLKQLNQPDFVRTVERNGYVFFFFREIAMEYMNCGKAIYSRVARVCKNDKGGPYAFRDRWTSFLKARLNCSIPGDYPFYFDEIQSTSQLIDGIYPKHWSTDPRDTEESSRPANNQTHFGRYFRFGTVIYGIFTTQMNAIPGSAVCAFDLNDILTVFEGRFKAQHDTNSNWLPVPQDQVPEPRPGKCVDDSRTLPSHSINFLKKHTLMESAVPAMFDRPLLTRVNLKHRFTAITVDPQIVTLSGKRRYDVIFVGTDDGMIVKFITIPVPRRSLDNDTDYEERMDFESVVLTETQALPNGIPVRQLTISKRTESLIVIGDGHIVSIPLHHCSKLLHCRDCYNMQDPYCAWDIANHECIATTSKRAKTDPSKFLQMLDQPTATIDVDVCHKHGNDIPIDSVSNWIDSVPIPQPLDDPIAGQPNPSTRGTVSSVGRVPSHDITVTSIDGVELTNQINKVIHLHQQLAADGRINGYAAAVASNARHPEGRLGDGEEKAAGINVAGIKTGDWIWFLVVAVILVLCIGIGFGWSMQRLHLFCGVQNKGEHRNHLNWGKRHIQRHNPNAKDINLLNANTFSSLPCVPVSQPNNKPKDNLEEEFGKDRSHECKNSTENLEKEAQSKIGTLQKVKKTYV